MDNINYYLILLTDTAPQLYICSVTVTDDFTLLVNEFRPFRLQIKYLKVLRLSMRIPELVDVRTREFNKTVQ